MPESVRLVGGSLVMVVGVAIVISAVFRALGENWPLVGHERWAVPLVGLGLLALGSWFLP